ncbi:MAG TPA: hypothetical protein VES67_03990, partial [Vicinamibacterales bacterium]|nr:hypothetical protein [Vicinamibacterales bacterium]
ATSFVLDYLGRVWPPIAGLKPLSLFAYYRPQQIVGAGLEASDITRLAGVMAAALVGAIVLFRRRDL